MASLCKSGENIISRLTKPQVLKSSISGIDSITGITMYLEFIGPGNSICSGETQFGKPHYFLPLADYRPVTEAIANGKIIKVRGRPLNGDFAAVAWET